MAELLVDPNGTDSGDCVGTACATIGYALTRASPGDVIRVATGKYVEAVTISEDVRIEGADRDATILQAASNQGAAGTRVVTVLGGAEVTIEGLTIRHGNAIGGNGGGVYNMGTLLLLDVLMKENAASGGGGGIQNTNGTVTLRSCDVMMNQGTGAAAKGGGVANFNGLMTIESCNIYRNTAEQGGGVANWAGGVLTATGTSVNHNSAPSNAGFGSGGGFLNLGDLALRDCDVSHNVAEDRGGGIQNGASLSVADCTFVSNRATNGSGGAIDSGTGGTVQIEPGVVFFKNSAGGAGGAISHATGFIEVRDCELTHNAAVSGAGGIHNIAGTLKIDASTISDNTGHHGGGIKNGGTATVTKTVVRHNTATFAGGGVGNSGTTRISNCDLVDNKADIGGAIDSFLGSLAIRESTLSRNKADQGGGISNRFLESLVTLEDSTLNGNEATTEGGAVRNNGRFEISNSTLSANTAERGGAIQNFGQPAAPGHLRAANVTLSGNRASIGGGINNEGGDVRIRNSIITFTGSGGDCALTGGTVVGNNNLIDNPGACAAIDSIGAVTEFDSKLADNGGPTQTHALLRGSNAIDAGADACLSPGGKGLNQDQRGVARPIDGDGDGSAICDIGAYEYEPG